MGFSDSHIAPAEHLAGLELVRVFSRWGVPQQAGRTQIQFSPRLRTSLGICYPSRKLIRLHPFLAAPESKASLAEVVCHEAAHIAAPLKAGKRVKPHGPEWQALVKQCGYEPCVRVKVPGFPVPSPRRSGKRRPLRKYEHRCPVCQTWRLASRPQPRWRCADCVDAGLDGELTITSLSSAKSKGATTR